MLPVQHFGFDADKRFLTVACDQVPGRADRLPNDGKAIEAWLDHMPADSVLAVESTGACHQLLLQCAVRRGVEIYVLNPRDIRHYAEGVRQRAKTDRVDAHVIARYIAREKDRLRPYVEPPAGAARLEHLLRRRALIVRTKTQLKLGLEDMPSPELNALNASFKALLAAIDRAIETIMAQDEEHAQQRELLRSIPGVGPLSSVALVSLFWRLPDITADALIAFTGFDPRPRDSGNHTGQRRLSKRGDAEIRRLSYMAAKTFARNDLGKPLYDRYRQRGLSHTAAYVILARKILRLAHALVKQGVRFDPDRFAAACRTT